MTKTEAKELIKAAERRKIRGTKTAIKDWIIIHIGLSTGLRASEISSLECHHLELDNEENPNIFVEKGKTIHSRRRIPIDKFLVRRIKEFQKYKESWAEEWIKNTPFLCSHKGRAYRRENIYIMFKRVLALAENIERPQRFYTHSMRHTFALRVYQKTNYNVELVRQLLGHSSLEITMIYLAAFNCEKIAAIKGLYD